MKRRTKICAGIIALAISVAGAGLAMTTTQAATKKKANTKFSFYLNKKGTLTIQGKGAMPNSFRFAGNKKIKKVVIKKGATGIPAYAFNGCKNLTQVRMPKTLKKIGYSAFRGTAIKNLTIPKKVKKIGGAAFVDCNKLTKVTMPGSFKIIDINEETRCDIIYGKKLDTIKLSTPLNLECSGYMRAKNIKVSKNDKKYKSINGIVYSKDGKDLVRVPYMKKKVKILEGCKNIWAEAFLYGIDICDDGYYSYCENEEITIPESVETISSGKYGSCADDENPALKKLTVKTQKLNDASVWLMLKTFTNFGQSSELQTISKTVTPQDVLKQLNNYTLKNNMYISSNNALMAYVGNDEVVTIPEGVKVIMSEAVAGEYWNYGEARKMKKIVMPDSVEEIRDDAFSNNENLTEIVWSKSIKTIGKTVVGNCPIKVLELPAGVENISEMAFAYGKIESVVIPEGYTSLPDYCFWANLTLKNVTFPSTFEKLSSTVFGACDQLDIKKLIQGTNIKYEE